MRWYRRMIPVMLSFAMLFAQPVGAFTNNTWTQVEGYESRQVFYVDNGELVSRFLDLYYHLNKGGDSRSAATKYFQGLMKSSDGVYRSGGVVTKGTLSNALYQTVQKMYPDLSLTGGDEITYGDTVEENWKPAVQFLLSRGIIQKELNGNFEENNKLTLGQALEIMDRFVQAAPTFPVYVPPVAKPEPVAANTTTPTPTPTVSGKNVYLTFDDSTSDNTAKILDVLKQYGVHATFFIAGKGDADLIRRMVAEGNAVGVHTMSHDYSQIYASSAAFWADIEEEASYLESVLGYRTNLLRFPGGSNNTVSKKYSSPYIMPTLIAQAAEKGYIYFDWNASSGDAAANTVAKNAIVSNTIQTSKGKSNVVLLMHQTKPKTTTPQALPEIIQWYIDQGYSFGVLSDTSFRAQFHVSAQ